MTDLHILFDNLPSIGIDDDAVDNLLSAEAINNSAHKIAKDSKARPLLLLEIGLDHTLDSLPPPIILEHLSISHQVKCRIQKSSGNNEEGKFSIIHCTSENPIMHSLFLDFVTAVFLKSPSGLSQENITDIINNLVELFRSLSKPPRKSIQGLWSEIFVISQAKNPGIMISAWHLKPDDRYDFCLDSQCVEVKSTINDIRKHYFSLEQARPKSNCDVLVASLFVEKSQRGKSIWDLLSKIRKKVQKKPELALYIEHVVSQTLGTNWKYIEERYDDRVAKRTLCFFHIHDVPSVQPNIPKEVSNVRFLSDMSNVIPIQPENFGVQGGLFAALT